MASLPRLYLRIEGQEGETTLVCSERVYRIVCDAVFQRRERINTLGIGRLTYHVGNGSALKVELSEQADLLPLMPD